MIPTTYIKYCCINDLLHLCTDYRSGPYTATFLARSTISDPLYINITDDDIVESTESFVLYIDPLTLPSGTSTAYRDRVTVFIYDNDSK